MAGKYRAYSEYKDSGVEWLGKVPSHWILCSFRHCLKGIFNGLTSMQIEESKDTVPVTRIETISTGVIDEDRLGFISSKDAREDRKLMSGDILFSNINSLSMIGNCAIYTGGRDIYAGMNLLVLKPDYSVDSQWLYWLIKSSIFRQVIESLAKPAINQASISQSSINSIAINVPMRSEQTTIANFLNQETAKIDSLIEKQQQLIKLLKEKRQAVISHAVTKGLNPDAPMRDSGVEWLGAVPAHWEIKQAKHVFILQRGHDLSSDKFIEGIYPVFGSNGSIGYHNEYTTNAPSLTVGRSGSVGEVNYIEENFWAHNTSLYLKETKNSEVKFIYYLLLAMDVKSLSAGSAVGTLDRNNIHAMNIAHPNINEQNQIIIFLDEKLQQFSELTKISNQAIKLMQERRTALISAAVTGKIDVRHWQAPEPSTHTQHETLTP